MFILQPQIIALLGIILLIGKCNANPMIWQRQEPRSKECMGCGNECDKCKYGVTVSALCGTEECLRGPGEYCGGPSQSWGVCGEGMICSCDRCVGCSVDFLTCFTQSCLPHQNLEQRGHHDMGDRVYPSRSGKSIKRLCKMSIAKQTMSTSKSKTKEWHIGRHEKSIVSAVISILLLNGDGERRRRKLMYKCYNGHGLATNVEHLEGHLISIRNLSHVPDQVNPNQ